MAKAARVEIARSAFAEITGELEDATLIAAEAQATRDLATARPTCDRLITALEACLGRLQSLRRRLG